MKGKNLVIITALLASFLATAAGLAATGHSVFRASSHSPGSFYHGAKQIPGSFYHGAKRVTLSFYHG